MEHSSLIAIEILKAARRWVAARVVLRRIIDSKSATQQQLDQAKKAHVQASDELEALVMRLERFLHNSGKKFPTHRGSGPSKTFPWQDFFGMVAAGAKAVESALSSTKNIVDAKIIDVEPPKK